ARPHGLYLCPDRALWIFHRAGHGIPQGPAFLDGAADEPGQQPAGVADISPGVFAAMSAHPALDAPSAWVARFAPLVPPGEVLDLACGSGRHARLLAAAGHPVLAVDRDPAALAACAGPGI